TRSKRDWSSDVCSSDLALPYILLIAELGVVFYLSARIEKMSVGTARAMFFVYAALNGVVFSVYFLIFHVTVLMGVFFITALFFEIGRESCRGGRVTWGV